MEINPNEQKPTTPVSRNKTSPWLIAALCTSLLAAMAGAWFFFTPDKQLPGPIQTLTGIDNREENVPVSPQPPSRQPETADTKTATEIPATDEKAAARADEQQDLTPQQQCALLTDNLTAFFDHLDQEPYIKEFNLNKPSRQYFSELTAKLLANPPVVSRESDDLYTILTNMAHFFRIIGRQNVLLMKGILDRERDKIEDVAAELYKWTIVDQCSDESFQMKAPLDRVYEYAGFFLNTMGGRSYLFRRDSRSRLLVNYYAILIVDRANKKSLNQYGLDIKELIPRLIEEIESTNQLIYKEDYIDRLLELQERYQG